LELTGTTYLFSFGDLNMCEVCHGIKMNIDAVFGKDYSEYITEEEIHSVIEDMGITSSFDDDTAEELLDRLFGICVNNVLESMVGDDLIELTVNEDGQLCFSLTEKGMARAKEITNKVENEEMGE
jgi:hypothetical protein